MFMNKYFIPEMQLTEKVNKISSITNWKITQKDKLITSEQKQTMVQFHGWFPLSLVNGYNFHKSVLSSHEHLWTYCSLFMHPIIREWLARNGWESALSDNQLLFSCFTCTFHVTTPKRLSYVSRQGSCTEQFRSIKMRLRLMSMMSITQEAESPVIMVTVVHNFPWMRNNVEVTQFVTCSVTAQSNQRFVVATVKSYFYIQSTGYWHQ